MDGSERADDFIATGLASLGIGADETELATVAAVHQLFWPPIQEFLALDLGDVEPERDIDLSRAPR